MKEYLEEKLHIKVNIKEAKDMYESLPLSYQGQYEILDVETAGVSWLAMKPKREVGLVQLRKNRAFVQKTIGRNCAVFLEKTSFYSRESMIRDGIPFVLEGKDIYLPFIGILLSGEKERDIQPVQAISFLTQRLLLSGILDQYDQLTVTRLSERLDVSKMAISKCFDEIEYLGINVLGTKGKSRVLNMKGERKELWNTINPFLRDPVIRRFVLKEDLKLDKLAGISALCKYSLLEDNDYRTYAVTKDVLAEYQIKDAQQVRRGEEIGCVVLELGYFIDSVQENVQDPLSVLLTLKNESDDERIELSIEKMLEEYVW